VGFAKSLTDAETRTLLWNRGAIALVVLAGGLAGGFLFLTWVTRPVVDVSNQAERLSLGDMDVRLDLKCKGEIGRVYLSLERLRESVMYAFRRLNNREQTMKEAVEPEQQEEDELPKGDRR
jgi:methyl-accepting chemotaxis protein